MAFCALSFLSPRKSLKKVFISFQICSKSFSSSSSAQRYIHNFRSHPSPAIVRRSKIPSLYSATASITTPWMMTLRGGNNYFKDDDTLFPTQDQQQSFSSKSTASSTSTEWEKLANPAPGSPFHLAMPVHDLEVAKDFYGNVLGCAEGRSSEKWQDYSLNGHQIVCHWVGNDYRCKDYFNPVDGDDIPVPHFGLALTEDEFHAMVARVRAAGIKFIVEPHLRFKGMPGEQWTMFFKDPSGNNLEFKAMTTIDNLFAKYNVKD